MKLRYKKTKEKRTERKRQFGKEDSNLGSINKRMLGRKKQIENGYNFWKKTNTKARERGCRLTATSSTL